MITFWAVLCWKVLKMYQSVYNYQNQWLHSSYPNLFTAFGTLHSSPVGAPSFSSVLLGYHLILVLFLSSEYLFSISFTYSLLCPLFFFFTQDLNLGLLFLVPSLLSLGLWDALEYTSVSKSVLSAKTLSVTPDLTSVFLVFYLDVPQALHM